jgi:hypothetical protein
MNLRGKTIFLYLYPFFHQPPYVSLITLYFLNHHFKAFSKSTNFSRIRYGLIFKLKSKADMESNSKIRTTGLLIYGLFFTGLCLVMLSAFGSEVLNWPMIVNAFIRDVGLLLSAVMAGTLLHEKLLRDEMMKDIFKNLDERLKERIPDCVDNANLISKTVHQLFSETPPELKGIKLINDTRRNFAGYYSWVIEQKQQNLFFAGRSVLHRIDADIRSRTDVNAETIILRKLKEGSQLTILFLDPRIDIIDRLANEEGQTPELLLGDIATSLGICKRLFSLLNDNFRQLPNNAGLSIRIYDRVPYFAYHKQGDYIIVGFYFLSGLGSTSAAYELLDKRTKDFFSDHFIRIYSEASSVVDFDGGRGRPKFNEKLFKELYSVLETRLGNQQVNELFNKDNNNGIMHI